jgi:hydrogenase expression/formation protein HypD
MEAIKAFKRLLAEMAAQLDRPITFMEVCGTHTMAIARCGLKAFVPSQIRLVSGPGCPVCVSPISYVDHALALARKKATTIASFGDLIRVPGSQHQSQNTFSAARASGASIEVVYSPLQALDLAKKRPGHEIVFLGVGFETTAPGLAATVLKAKQESLGNFSMLSAVKTIPEALAILAGSDDLRIDGFLCPGHVSAITGESIYQSLVEDFNTPCAIAGFEPLEIIEGLCCLLAQVLKNKARVDNCYPVVVKRNGNPKAREMIRRVFEPCDAEWRGLGTLLGSGLKINDEFSGFDAAVKIEVDFPDPVEPQGCRCGDVLRGLMEPKECRLFGTTCTPEQPQGACMVSQEGSCAAQHMYASDVFSGEST